jgi:hypothetical protein
LGLALFMRVPLPAAMMTTLSLGAVDELSVAMGEFLESI